MSYSIDQDEVVRNNEDTPLGSYDKSTKTFSFLTKENQRFKAHVSSFLKRSGRAIDSWEVAGEVVNVNEGGKIPPRPKWNPKWADKTPSYVRWLEKYHLEEFKAVYKVVGRGIVPIYEEGVKVGEKETWIAKRKTCLTELVDLPLNLDPDLYDLNAE